MMNFAEYVIFNIDKAIEMLMDNKTSKTEVAMFLMGFKKCIEKPEKEIIDGDFEEINEK